jgi:hypothetical protein
VISTVQIADPPAAGQARVETDDHQATTVEDDFFGELVESTLIASSPPSFSSNEQPEEDDVFTVEAVLEAIGETSQALRSIELLAGSTSKLGSHVDDKLRAALLDVRALVEIARSEDLSFTNHLTPA